MNARYKKYELEFKRPSGTSRGVLTTKETWFLMLENEGKLGIGECGLLRGLSIDDRPDYEEKLSWLCQNIHLSKEKILYELTEFPSLQFGYEMAVQSLESNNTFELYPSAFTRGKDSIPINGLIWMGDKEYMKTQIEEKLQQGFSCIKLKIGAIDFEKELALLAFIRKHYSAEDIELRVDANGAFAPSEALEKINALSAYKLHSIEQPIKQGQWDDMKKLCEATPLPIALDEELIGLYSIEKKQELLRYVIPQYIILKPSLIGGFQGTEEWISLAEQQQIEWWITSALESNIGLNAIAQWTYKKDVNMPQGLGTGSLYTNNIECPLTVVGENLTYHNNKPWNITNLI